MRRCLACEVERNGDRPQYAGDWPARSAQQLARQPWCSVCGHTGSPDNPLTADHIVPVAHGGADGPLDTKCRRHNSEKGSAWPR